MKNRILFICSIACLISTIIACTSDTEIIGETTSEDYIIGIIGQPNEVDLVISNYITNNTVINTNCGLPRPDISCLSGNRFFTVSVTISNNGSIALPAGILSVDWIDTDITPSGRTVERRTYNHSGIGLGGTLVVSRNYFVGRPCNCPPTNYFSHLFSAEVDPGNLIPELNELNNSTFSRSFCNDCL